MIKRDKYSGLCLFLLFLAAFLFAKMTFPERASYYVLIVTVLGMFLSLWLFVGALIKQRAGKDEPVKKLPAELRTVVAVITVSIVIYAIIIPIIGYIISTLIFMIGTILYLYTKEVTKKYVIIAVIIAIITSLILYFVFGKLLYIPLPSGFLV